MRPRSWVDRTTEARISQVMRSWDRFKVTHPAAARRVAPLLLFMWQMALRRRATWARLREGQPLPEVITGAGVAERHIIEEPEASVAARIEFVFLVPGLGVLLTGWLYDPLAKVVDIRVRTRSSVSGNIRSDLVRSPRPDVVENFRSWGRGQSAHPGLTCLVELPGASPDEIAESLSVELRSTEGATWVLEPRPMVNPLHDPLPVIRDLLAVTAPRDVAMLEHHVGPAVAQLWRPTEEDPVVLSIGDPPEEPKTSLVIPVYGRYDLIEYQMAVFADDADVRVSEVIYVIDDPRIVDDVARLCRSIEPIFQVPCRLVLCSSNHGFAGATNIGARVARGELLLLMNSDVIPREAGWLSSLVDAYSRLPAPGALGPRLLFPDGSLQHDGMAFTQLPWLPGIWINDHPGKGLPASPATTKEPVRAQAVTAACLMISRASYWDVGGLDEGYVIGDFEDSDLCLKLLQQGRESWVAPWVELYHLERQSQALTGEPQWRQSLTLYNAWRHTNRWAEVIERLASGRPT